MYNSLLSVELLEHTFLAEKVKAMFDELRLHSNTHT